jgi:hypothetical protein
MALMRTKALVAIAMVGSLPDLAVAQPKQVQPPQSSQPTDTRQKSPSYGDSLLNALN